MPQLSNLTIGAAVSLSALAQNELFRVVPQVKGATSVAFENSTVGSPELASKFSASTSRKANGTQSSMIRLSLPVIRDIDGQDTRVATNVVEVTCAFPAQATAVERENAVNHIIRALKHNFFNDVLVNGEAMT